MTMKLLQDKVERNFNSECRNKTKLSSCLSIYCTFHAYTKWCLFSPSCAHFFDPHLKNDKLLTKCLTGIAVKQLASTYGKKLKAVTAPKCTKYQICNPTLLTVWLLLLKRSLWHREKEKAWQQPAESCIIYYLSVQHSFSWQGEQGLKMRDVYCCCEKCK